MTSNKKRRVMDSMGELEVDEGALYGAQTQRALNNFPISGVSMPVEFIKALLQIKRAAALGNHNWIVYQKKLAVLSTMPA